MRVLHVVGNLDPASGGSTSAAFHTCGYLRQHNIDAVLAGTWEGPGAADYITDEWPELPVHGFSRRPPHHYWHSPALRRWLRSTVRSFDLVLIHGIFKLPFVDAALAARRTGTPYVVQPHNSLDPYDLRKHRAMKGIYGPLVAGPLLRRAAGVLVTSPRERELLVTYGAKPDVQVIPLPVAGPIAAPDGAAFRRQFRISEDAPVVLFLSRLDPKKGLERLLEAVAALRHRHPGLRLLIVGPAEGRAYANRLKADAARLGVDDIVVWAGMVLGSQRWDAFAAGDVFALPSDNENFGIVVLESLLAGTPAVISNEVYIADEVAATGGATVCGTDVVSLTAELDRALSGIAGPRVTAATAAALEERFSPAAVARETIRYYDSIVAPQRA